MEASAQLPVVSNTLPAAAAAPSSGAVLTSWTRLPPRQTMTLLVVVALAVAAAVGGWLWAQTPDYRVLYSNVSDRDGGAILRPVEGGQAVRRNRHILPHRAGIAARDHLPLLLAPLDALAHEPDATARRGSASGDGFATV